MWHEARRQEKLVRKVIVDYRKRAERRQEYYENIKQDPTKFMQIHGRKCKLHIDENGVASDSSSYMMPWQNDKSNMIDRFDVRAHLDFIPQVQGDTTFDFSTDKQERKCQYERYRILVYNKHRGVSESQHLKQIRINENYPELTAQKQEAEAKKQLLAASKATIAYSYDEEGQGSSGSKINPSQVTQDEDDDDEDDWSEEEFLNELEDVPSVNKLNAPALKDLENLSFEFGLYINDFTDSLKSDQSIVDKMNKAKALESEKAKMSGKKSRRERRIMKDNRLKNRTIGPLSYILRQSDDNASEADSASESSSSSEDESPSKRKSSEKDDGKIEFITSFGHDNNCATESASLPVKSPFASNRRLHHKPKKRSRSPVRRRRSRSRSRSRDRRHESRRRSRSPLEYSRRRRSRSHERHRRSRSRSRSRDRRSVSPERRRRSRSRSRGAEKPIATLKSTSTPNSSQTKKLTPQERLKIKMQRALKKQLKADKIASADKRAKVFQEQLEREEELQKMSRKIRKREDERLEMYDGFSN